MKRSLFALGLLSVLVAWALWAPPAVADSGHARVVRLSLVQGDVRYARQFHKDALDDSKAVWERAPLNLPIREGFALATDNNARAEVEFENGAMAFLSPNTLIEFYDLSLQDGSLVSRLILRQGSAVFYVHPATYDFFSVTGGDFSVQANGRSRFRLDNFDNGSTVRVEQGQVAVLRNKETKPLEKGQSYSINVFDSTDPVIARSSDSDDFDKWVSSRIDSVATASAYANQYVNSLAYTSGFADLYSFGGWYNVPGYGFCWQPFGVGLGWSPFTFGNWYYDASLGWNFIGSAPWGWLPYHFGGWIFDPVMGWMWVPTGFGYYGGPFFYQPVTGVWVNSGGVNGIVPINPVDKHGKPPINLRDGIYPIHGNAVAPTPIPAAGQKWSVMNHPPRDVFPVSHSVAAPVSAPTRVARASTSAVPGRASASVGVPASRSNALNLPHSNAAIPGRTAPPRPSVAPPRAPVSAMHAGNSSGGGAVWGGSRSGASTSAPSSAPASTSSSSAHSSGGHH